MTEIRRLSLDGVILFTPRRFGDNRGDFAETYKKSVWTAAGVAVEFVQENHSRSVERFTLRGLHLQASPFAQGKLVRVVRGRVWDVAVDVRNGSPSFGTWVAAELSAEKGDQLYIPVGFLHGFLTLEPNTEVVYKVTAEYSKPSEMGVIWNDPTLGIDWPLGDAQPVLSEKDTKLPLMADFATPFAYS